MSDSSLAGWGVQMCEGSTSLTQLSHPPILRPVKPEKKHRLVEAPRPGVRSAIGGEPRGCYSLVDTRQLGEWPTASSTSGARSFHAVRMVSTM